MSLEICRFRKIEKTLSFFSDRIAKNIVIGGVRAGANIIRTEARYLAPRAEKTLIKKFKGQSITVKPGFMAASIRSWLVFRSKGGDGVGDGVGGSRAGLQRFPSTSRPKESFFVDHRRPSRNRLRLLQGFLAGEGAD